MIRLKDLLLEAGRFNPSNPLAKVSPEWENTRVFHGLPDIRTLRRLRLIWGDRPQIRATATEYEFKWIRREYDEDHNEDVVTLTFSTKKPETYRVELTHADYRNEKLIMQKIGHGKVESAIQLVKQLSKKFDV